MSGARRAAAAFAVLLLAFGLAACSGGRQRAGGRHDLDLKIGDIVPLSGTYEAFGLPGRKSADLAIEQIRQAIAKAKARHKVTILHENNRSEVDLSVSLARKLIDGGSSCIVGPWDSLDVQAVATRLTVPKRILEITPAASSDTLRRLEIGGYVNRTVMPDRLEGPTLARLIASELGGAKGKKVNIGGYKSIYANTIAASFSAAWKKLGGTIGARVFYEPNLASYRGQAEAITAGHPDAFLIADFQDNWLKVGPELVRTKKWTASKTFATDSLAVSSLPLQGEQLADGMRGVVPSSPRFTPLAKAWNRLYRAGPPPKYRQSFDTQAFDAVVLCYLSAVAAGTTKSADMADWVRKVSSPPGTKYTWRQLPQAILALQNGKEIDYQGASGPIDMDGSGNPRAGFYDAYKYKSSRLQLYGQLAVPNGSLERFKKPTFVTPLRQVPGAIVPKGPSGATGATGATGIAGATGATGAKSKTPAGAKKKSSTKR